MLKSRKSVKGEERRVKKGFFILPSPFSLLTSIAKGDPRGSY